MRVQRRFPTPINVDSLSNFDYFFDLYQGNESIRLNFTQHLFVWINIDQLNSSNDHICCRSITSVWDYTMNKCTLSSSYNLCITGSTSFLNRMKPFYF